MSECEIEWMFEAKMRRHFGGPRNSMTGYNSPIDDSQDIPWCRNYLKVSCMSMCYCLADVSTIIAAVPKLKAVESTNHYKYSFTSSDWERIN